MYSAYVLEHDLICNYLQGSSTSSSTDSRRKLVALVAVIDDLQFSDIPKLRDDIKCYLKSINTNNTTDIDDFNDTKTGHDQVYTAIDSNIVNNNTPRNNENRLVIETNDNYTDNNNGNDNNSNSSSTTTSNNIVDVYVATIPNHSNSNTITDSNQDSTSATSTYSTVLMNELFDALQLISYTERVNKFDEDNTDDNTNYNTNDNTNNNTDDNTNDTNRVLPLQLNANVALDLHHHLSMLLKPNNDYIEDDDIG